MLELFFLEFGWVGVYPCSKHYQWQGSHQSWVQLISSLIRFDHYEFFLILSLNLSPYVFNPLDPSPLCGLITSRYLFQSSISDVQSDLPFSLLPGGLGSLRGSPSAWVLFSHCFPSSLVLLQLIYLPSKGEALEFNILLLMIKNHLLSKCILINVILIKS